MIRSMKSAIAASIGLGAALAVPAAAADALPCAEYVTTAIDDEPGMGQLIGTEERTETVTFSLESAPGGVGGGATYTKTVTYEVGIYDMGGYYEQLDCRDYTRTS